MRQLEGPILAVPAAASGPLAQRLRENVPSGAIAVPLLIAQGQADALIPPSLQEAFVAQRCAAGQHLEYRTYAGRDHMGILATDSPLVTDLLRWTQDRLAGVPQAPGCRTIPN